MKIIFSLKSKYIESITISFQLIFITSTPHTLPLWIYEGKNWLQCRRWGPVPEGFLRAAQWRVKPKTLNFPGIKSLLLV